MTDEQFDRYTLELLARKLGPRGLARFLRLHRSGPGDYTQERGEWQRVNTVQEIAEAIVRDRER